MPTLVHYEGLMDIESKSEETYAIQNDTMEMYERKWEKYNNAMLG